MQPRTEEEARTNAPIKVRLGLAEYEIKPLTWHPSQEWRKKLVETIGSSVEEGLKAKTPANLTPESVLLIAAMTPGFKDLPHGISELVFAYAPYLPKEEILNTATEGQMVAAFNAILQVGFPYMSVLAFFARIARGDFSAIQ